MAQSVGVIVVFVNMIDARAGCLGTSKDGSGREEFVSFISQVVKCADFPYMFCDESPSPKI